MYGKLSVLNVIRTEYIVKKVREYEMERKVDIVVNFFVRAIVGITLIFFINEFLVTKGITADVGINPVNFTVAGIFGIPGVALLYGIGLY